MKVFNYILHQPILCFSHVILLVNSPPMVVCHQLVDIYNFVGCLQSFNRTLPVHLIFHIISISILSLYWSGHFFFLTPYTIQRPHSSVCRPWPHLPNSGIIYPTYFKQLYISPLNFLYQSAFAIRQSFISESNPPLKICWIVRKFFP